MAVDRTAEVSVRSVPAAVKASAETSGIHAPLQPLIITTKTRLCRKGGARRHGCCVDVPLCLFPRLSAFGERDLH